MSAAASPPVAKKKAAPTPESAPPAKKDRKPMVVQVRGSDAWKAWAEEMAAKEGDTLAKFVDRTFRKWAKDTGHREPPTR